ncbi:MAG: hypothetical protein V4594_04460 [Bacteroidota bacterium]
MFRSFLCFIIFFPVYALSQSNFKKGYLLTSAKDTIKGFVDFQEHKKSPSAVNFKRSTDGTVEIFNPTNCSGYGIDGFEYYESHLVKVSLSAVDINKVSNGLDSSSVQIPVFLEVIQKGKNLTLYAYTDVIKTRFFLLASNDKQPYELVRQVYMDHEGTKNLIRLNTYRGQLNTAAGLFDVKNKIDEKKLKNLRYGKREILEVVSIINEQKIVRSQLKSTRFFAGTGMIATYTRYSGAYFLAGENATNGKSFSPFVSLGLDIFANPAVGKSLFRLEAGVNSSKNHIYNGLWDHKFDYFTVTLAPQFIYNFYNAEALKIYAGGGVSVGYAKYTNNEVRRYYTIDKELYEARDAIDFTPVNWSVITKIGVVFDKKFELSAGYFPGAPLATYSGFKVKATKLSFGVNYLFGGH